MKLKSHIKALILALITVANALLLSTVHASASQNSTQPELLRIASHELKPYHWVDQNNKLVGPALEKLECVLTALEQTYEISVYPWPRAQKLVRHGAYDAFFISSQNAKRDQYAEFATPFYFDSWYFFYHPQRDFTLSKTNIKGRYLGVLLGSNMEQWAKKNSYINLLSGKDYTHLFKLLALERLDIVMATKGIYEAEMKLLNWPVDKFVSEKIKRLEMGMYFGHHFLAKYPKYMREFNNAARDCSKLANTTK